MIVVLHQLRLTLERLSHVVVRGHVLVGANVRVRRMVTAAAEDAARCLAVRGLLSLLLLLALVSILLLVHLLVEGLLTRDLECGLDLMRIALRRRRRLCLHLGYLLLVRSVGISVVITHVLVLCHCGRVPPVFLALVRAVRQSRVLMVALRVTHVNRILATGRCSCHGSAAHVAWSWLLLLRRGTRA